MTAKELLNKTRAQLDRASADQLIENVLGVTGTYFFAHGDEEVSAEKAALAETLAARCAAGEPLQYVLGSAAFMGLDFYVDENVLIPRPETELLCERAEELIREKQCYLSALSGGTLIDAATGNSKCTSCFAAKKGLCAGDVCAAEFSATGSDAAAETDGAASAAELSVLDVCTGSGAIAVWLAHEFPEVRVTASDISEAALAVARKNAERLIGCGSAENPEGAQKTAPGFAAIAREAIRFVHSDLFEGIEGSFDLITANPPYIPAAVIDTLEPNVRDHEPRLALDGGASGFELPLRLIKTSRAKLRPGGVLLMEIGDDQGARALEAAANCGFRSCRIHKDYAGQDRILEASL